MWRRRLGHVTQGALQSGGAVDDHSHQRPGGTPACVCPTCDDVLDGAILALIDGPVLLGLPPAELCDQLVLLLPLLLRLDLHEGNGSDEDVPMYASLKCIRERLQLQLYLRVVLLGLLGQLLLPHRLLLLLPQFVFLDRILLAGEQPDTQINHESVFG